MLLENNPLLILFRRPHEYQTVAQAGEHVDSLFVLNDTAS